MAFLISTPNNASFSKCPIPFKFFSPNASLDVQLCVDGVVVYSGNLPSDSEAITWDVQHILDDCLSCECPPFGGTDMIRHRNNFKNYSIKYKESDVEDYTETEEFCVVCGGLESKSMGIKDEFFDKIQFLDTFVLRDELGIQDYKCRKKITSAEPLWLSIWLPSGNSQEIIFGFTLKLKDGTFTGSQIAYDINQNDVGFKGVFSFPAGYCQLAEIFPNLTPAEDIDSIRFTIGNGVNIDIVDYQFCCHESHFRYYLFCNCLGGIESFHTEGGRVERSSVDRLLALGTDSKRKSQSPKNRKSYTERMGDQFSEHCSDWMESIIMAKDVWEVCYNHKPCECLDPKKGALSPVIIEGGSFVTRKENPGLFDFELSILVSCLEQCATPNLFFPLDKANVSVFIETTGLSSGIGADFGCSASGVVQGKIAFVSDLFNDYEVPDIASNLAKGELKIYNAAGEVKTIDFIDTTQTDWIYLAAFNRFELNLVGCALPCDELYYLEWCLEFKDGATFNGNYSFGPF